MDNRNYILAIALSLVVLVGWQFLVVGPQIEQERQRAEMQAQNELSQMPDAPAPEVEPDNAPTSPADNVTLDRNEAIAQGTRIAIETAHLEGSINLQGGRIDDLRLIEYHETPDPSSPTIVLFSPSGSPDPYFTDFGWTQTGNDAALPGPQTVWQAPNGAKLTPSTPVTLTWDNGAGLVFTRTISIDDDYLFDVTQSVENSSGADLTLFPYSLISRRGMPEVDSLYILHEGLVGFMGEEGLVEIDYDDVQDEGRLTYRNLDRGWLGITDKYWAAALIPQAPNFRAEFRLDDLPGEDAFVAAYLGDAMAVSAGQTAEVRTLLFAGAKEVSVIDRYDETYGISQFDLLIDWGWFYFLTKPIFYALDWLFKLVGNFGVAILLLTVGIKLIFLPLANKSYASMSRMKKVQPQMKEIQERHKDDRMAMQKAMMELYKKEKINPVSGCWPILIQIPVFFALYKVLYVTIEMRHAPFFGWINDLSAPDPTSLFNLFGLLPYDTPAFLTIGIWPILMGITMFIQMKLNPTPQDPTQAMIFNWMPLFFVFLLAPFPAGLVIYWTWNNFLSVIQQSFIMKRHGVKIELMDNMKGLFSKKKPEDTGSQ
jgi:YidC/Oxa1 family membrane protein insertase